MIKLIRIAGISVFGAIAALLLRRLRPEMSAALAMAAGALLIALVFPFITQVVDGVNALAAAGNVRGEWMTQLIKVAGVSLLADFAAQTCRDAGEEGLAVKTELAGRITLLAMAMPALRQLLDQFLSLAG